MQPCYCIIDGQSNEQIPASIREATATDFERTAREHWQTDWRTDFIQDTTLEKYALELDATKELVGLAAYRDMPEGVLVYVEYMESAPSGNPTLSKTRVYLKTPNAPGQRTFSRCAAPFFLEIRQYSCEKMSCSTQKIIAAGHIMSFQIHPRKTC